MKRLMIVFALLLVVVSGSVQAAPPLAEQLPADSIVYVGWAGRNHAFDGSRMGELISQPAVTEMIGSLKGVILSKLAGQDEPVAAIQAAMKLFSVAWQHKAAIAITAMPEGTKDFSGVILIDLGQDRQKFDDALQDLLKLAPEGLELTDGSAGAVTYKSFQPKENAPVLSFGYMGDVFFLTAGKTMPARVVSLASEADKSLLNAPAFAEVWAQVGGENEQMAMYADVQGITKMVSQLADANLKDLVEFAQVIDALGLADLSAIACSTQIVDRNLLTKTRIVSPAPHQGLLSLCTGKPLKLEDLSIVPADADVVLTMGFDPSALLKELRTTMTKIDEDAAGKISDGLAGMDQQFGISIEDDLLAHMGDRMTVMSAPSLGGFATGTAIVIDLKDAAKFRASLDKVEAKVAEMIAPRTNNDMDEYQIQRAKNRASALRTMMVGQTKITYVQIPQGRMPFAPAWAVHGDKLIVAAWPQVVQAVITGTKAGTLDKDPQFLEAFAKVSQNPSILMYVNTPKIVRQLYALPMIGWTMAANAAQKEGIPLRPEWLPALTSIEGFLRPEIMTVRTDESGITAESFSSLPLLSNSLASVPLGVAVALPALGKARERAKQTISMANLRNLGMAAQMYAAENGGRFPNDQKSLEPYTGQMLVSPITGKQYIWLPRGDINPDLVDRPHETITAYEDPTGTKLREIAVLMADGHAETMRVDDSFWELLKESKQRVGAEVEDEDF